MQTALVWLFVRDIIVYLILYTPFAYRARFASCWDFKNADFQISKFSDQSITFFAFYKVSEHRSASRRVLIRCPLILEFIFELILMLE